MDQAVKKIGDWILGVRHELIEYGVNVVYLTLVLAAFTVHQRLVLAAHDITYTNYRFALIPFFAVKELGRVFGREKIAALVFRPRDPQ